MKIVYLALMVLLSGCSALMGVTEYSIKPIKNGAGDVICCEATVYNSKSYSELKFKLKKNADGSVSVTLEEKEVDAASPAAVQLENNAKLLDTLINVVTKVN